MIGLPKTGLWKYSLHKYVAKEKYEYVKFVNEIDKIENKRLTYISCFNDKINSRPKLDSIEMKPLKKSICDYIDNLDCVEVSLDKPEGKYLFVMRRRFIDNGYGLLYCKDEIDINDIYDERINGLEITSLVKIDKHWYYISFT